MGLVRGVALLAMATVLATLHQVGDDVVGSAFAALPAGEVSAERDATGAADHPPSAPESGAASLIRTLATGVQRPFAPFPIPSFDPNKEQNAGGRAYGGPLTDLPGVRAAAADGGPARLTLQRAALSAGPAGEFLPAARTDTAARRRSQPGAPPPEPAQRAAA